MNRILRIMGIDREIAGKASLLFAYLLLLICGFIISKAARDALFLTEFGALKLPYIYIGIAILTGLIVGIYTHFAKRVSKQKSLILSQAFVAAVFLLFWWLLTHSQWRWLVFAFYLWVTIYNAILISQFWLSANDLFDARQAKRAFAFIGSGGIIGGYGYAEFYNLPLNLNTLYYVGTKRRTVELHLSKGAVLIVIGGQAFPEQILMWWNFVARTQEEIEQARFQWEHQNFFGNISNYDGSRMSAPPLDLRFKR